MESDYHMELEEIADGKLEDIGKSLIYKSRSGKISFFDRGDFVLRDEVYMLPVSRGDSSTSSGRYRSVVDTVSDRDITLVRIADPYGRVDSMKLAEITASKLGDGKLNVVNMAEYCSKHNELNGETLWSPDTHERWGEINQDKTYLLAGFEKLSENKLKAIFQCPSFEVGFEHFQERKYKWEGKSHKHNILFLLTGRAEEVIDYECRRVGGQIIGNMQNFLERVFGRLKLYCVEKGCLK